MHADLGPIVLSDPINRSHPLNRGRTAWWLTLPGLEGGRQWTDLMGRNHGTLANMTTSASGWRGTTRPGGWGHLLFDGSDDRVGPISAPALDNWAEQTVALWAKMPAAPVLNYTRLVEKGANNEWSLNFEVTGTMIAAQCGSATYITGPVVTDGNWHHVALTIDAAYNLSLYADGARVAGPTFIATPTKTNAVTIGQYGGGSAFTFPGPIDDVGIWGRCLAPADLRSLHDLSRRGYPGVLRRLGSRAWRSAPAGLDAPAASYYQRRRRGA